MKWTDNPMFDLSPSYTEIQAAKKVFLQRVKHFAPFTEQPPGSPDYMSPETVIACAVAEVWREGRLYQRDQNSAALMRLAGMEVRT